MDAITLILAALAAGATLGVKDTASAVVTDAYAGLKALVKNRLGGSPEVELILAKHEQAPEIWRDPLRVALTETRADNDIILVAAAQALLDLVGEVGGPKYSVNVGTAQGLQVGDSNRQDNVFHAR